MLDVHAILREVSVVDAQKLLATTRAEKVAKEKEMQAMGGSRYQDLIDAADEIVSMHEASQRLDAALREMPSLWDSLESSVTLVMDDTASKNVFHVSAVDAAQPDDGNKNVDVVDIIVSASERMWVAMEQGNPLEALSIFKHVSELKIPEADGATSTELGFVAFELDSIPSFRSRILSCAKQCLRAPSRPTSFYEDALLVLLELEPSPTPDFLCASFLEGRSAAATALRQSRSSDKQQTVAKSLQLVLGTLADASSIFAAPSAKLPRTLTNVLVPQLEAACTSWAIETIQRWRRDLDDVLKSLHDVEAVAALQHSMQSHLDARPGSLVTWRAVQDALGQPTRDDVDLWTVFASDLFAKATQSLFRQAFDAAASQLTAALVSYTDDDATNDDDDNDVTATFIARLADLQRNDRAPPTLQPILTSECLRVLFDVVTSFVDSSFSTSQLLHVAQHCLDLAAAMSHLFPSDGKPAPAGTGLKGDAWPSILDAFGAHSSDGEKAANFDDVIWLQASLLPRLCEALRINVPQFEWLGDHARLTPHHVYFLHLATTQGGAATASAFDQLAHTFCRRWVAHVVRTHGQPVLDALTTARYFGYSNEEWRSVYHASWTQTPATITSDDDDDETAAKDDSLVVWLPWCATPAVSHLLFGVAVATASSMSSSTILHELVKAHVRSQLKQWILQYIQSVLQALSRHRDTAAASASSFGQACALQCIFDLYFVRVLVGESEFLRFGWGDHEDMAPLLAWVDPVDWEFFGPALVHLVKRQYHMTRLLFSVFLSHDSATDAFADAGFVVSDAGLTMLEVAAPVPRFALLPVPQSLKRAQSVVAPQRVLPPPVNVKSSESTPPPPKRASSSIHQILSSSTSLLTSHATAASVTATAATAAAKGMSLFSSASSYLRE